MSVRVGLSKGKALDVLLRDLRDPDLTADCMMHLLSLWDVILDHTDPHSGAADPAQLQRVLESVVPVALPAIGAVIEAAPLPSVMGGTPDKLRLTAEHVKGVNGVYRRAGEKRNWCVFNGHPVWERVPFSDFSIILGGDQHWWLVSREHIGARDWKEKPPLMRSSSRLIQAHLPHFVKSWAFWDAEQGCFVLDDGASDTSVTPHSLDATQISIVCQALLTAVRIVRHATVTNPLHCVRMQMVLPRNKIIAFSRVHSNTEMASLARILLDLWAADADG